MPETDKKRAVSVIGLGRVGLITSIHLAGKGFKVYAVDINKKLINDLKAMKFDFTEPHFNKLLQQNHKKIEFSASPKKAKYHFICVSTPFSEQTHKMDLSYVRAALKSISKTSEKTYIFIRSTLVPGHCRKLSQKFKHLSISYFPEFFREGCFIKDYKNAGFCVLGHQDTKSLQHFLQFKFSKQHYFLSVEEAEILKIACNFFHGLKISFANEIGRMAKKCKASPHKIMDVFVKDQSNVSKMYLRPGFSYGGPCLNKDIKSLKAFQNPLEPKLLLPQSVEHSNKLHTQFVFRQIVNLKPKTIGILGGSFTGNPTYDYRLSPVLQLAKMLSKVKTIRLYSIEEALTPYKCHIIPKKSIKRFLTYDMCILGGYNTFLKPHFFADYKGILFDLLIQNVSQTIKNHPRYKTAFL